MHGAFVARLGGYARVSPLSLAVWNEKERDGKPAGAEVIFGGIGY
jgi:hypothetical protein